MRSSSLASLGQGPSHKWWALAAVSVGIYMAVLDLGIVNISLPAMMGDFRTDFGTVQWVVLSYLLGVSAFLLPAGRLADLWGRKRVYTFGFAFFVLGTVLAGLAPSPLTLSLARVLMAAGGASLMANGLAITTSAFPSHERGKALGINSTVVALGAITGPTLGGLIVDSLGWRWVFFINAPVGAAGLVLATLILRESAISTALPGTKKGRFDWRGAIFSGAALVFALLALTQGDNWGWTSGLTMGFFAAAAVSAAAFLAVERKAEALVRLDMFRSRAFSAGLLAAFLVFSGISANSFLMPFYLQRVLDFSARTAGLLFIPLPVALAITGPLSGRLSDRVDSRVIASIGLIAVIAGLFNISRLDSASSAKLVMAWLGLLGIGMGMFQPPNNSAVLGTVPRSLYGVSAALLNLARQVGQATGVAVSGLIVTLAMTHAGVSAQLYSPGAQALGGPVVSAFTDGMRNAYLSATALALVALLASLVRGPRAQAQEPVLATAPARPSSAEQTPRPSVGS